MSRSDAETPAPVLLPAEHMPIGEEIDCGSYEVTEDEIVSFASQWDPQYFHIDPQAAAHSNYGGLIASGLHTSSIYQRLAVTGLYNRYDIIAGKEIRLRFVRPVRAGDVLTCTILVRSVEPDAPGRCLVDLVGTLRNQHGRPVLEVQLDSLVRSRDRAAR